MVTVKVGTVMRWYAQDDVDQEKSEQERYVHLTILDMALIYLSIMRIINRLCIVHQAQKVEHVL